MNSVQFDKWEINLTCQFYERFRLFADRAAYLANDPTDLTGCEVEMTVNNAGNVFPVDADIVDNVYVVLSLDPDDQEGMVAELSTYNFLLTDSLGREFKRLRGSIMVRDTIRPEPVVPMTDFVSGPIASNPISSGGVL